MYFYNIVLFVFARSIFHWASFKSVLLTCNFCFGDCSFANTWNYPHKVIQIFHLSTSNRSHITYQYDVPFCPVSIFFHNFFLIPFPSASSAHCRTSIIIVIWFFSLIFGVASQFFAVLLFIHTLIRPIHIKAKLDVIVFNDNDIAIASPHMYQHPIHHINGKLSNYNKNKKWYPIIRFVRF